MNNPFAIAKVDGNNGNAALFFCTSYYGNTLNGKALKLMKYVYNPVTHKYEYSWEAPYSARNDREMGQPIIADFNGDGVPEVLVLDKVFNAQTGALLVDGGHLADNSKGFGLGGHVMTLFRWVAGAPTTWSSIMAVADVDGDGMPEVIGGNTVYKVAINNKLSQDGTNTFLVSKTVDTEGRAEIVDGPTAVADMDGDGLLDVVVTGNLKTAFASLYVWNPRTGKLMHTSVVNGIPIQLNEHSASVPFIGDIDNDKQPEICVVGQFVVRAYEFDASAKTLLQKWSKATNDESAATSITMFDFDQDGSHELVYRDMTHLRILNGADGSDKITAIACESVTGNEYPVIVDINNDQAAEIVVTSKDKLRVFGSSSATDKWAPTRKVWNQFAYNAVNINEDLTVPAVQLNPATTFPGIDGILGTSDDIRPYNGYLMQQTVLNKNGNLLFLLPNAVIDGSPVFDYDASADSMVITVTVINKGDAAFGKPFKISVYKNGLPPSADKQFTYDYPNAINVGDVAVISFGIPKFKAEWSPFNDIFIQINDSGNGYANQLVCDSVGVMHKTGTIIASNDRVLLFSNSTNNEIPVFANDFVPSSCTTPVLALIPAKGPSNGTCGIIAAGATTISYTPAADFVGLDSFQYRLSCGGTDADTATVYINIVPMPDNVNDINCWINPPEKEWDILLDKQIGNVATTMAMVVGDLNEDGFPDIVAFGNRTRSTIKIFWGPEFDTHKEITVNADGNTNLGIARVKVSDVAYESLIFYRTGTTLRAIKADGTNPWATNPSCRNYGMISFADFNNDGWAEVYVGNQIYDAATGALLCDGGATKNSGNTMLVLTPMSQTIAVNILGDANLELVAGNVIFEVKINRTTPALSTITEISSVTPPVGCPNDGVTVVADFDNDGKLDVLVRRRNGATTSSKNIHLYLWSPHTGTNIGKMLANSIDTHEYFGVPFVGDIDGDGKVEIVTLGSNGVYETQKGFKALRYNENTNSFTTVWDINHKDQSGATGMTLFDFNNDGISEIVYRDENNLKIINGSGKSHKTGLDTIAAYTINSFTSYSETYLEYPIVVDIYGNQSSAILVTSDLDGPRILNNPPLHGYEGSAKIDIYTSNPSTPWAPARKVWNQYAYNAVNVNENLTIPAVPLPLATVFPGEDGQLGTSDDVRPYNNFLQQQTILNRNGVSVLSAPNISVEIAAPAPTYTYIGNGDSLFITATIHNTGDAELRSPVYITVYKDVVDADTVKYIYPYLGNVPKGASIQVQFSVPNFTTWLGETTATTALILKINDKGEAKDDQPVCQTGYTTHTELYSGMLIANNDYITTLFSINIKVLNNDLYPATCTLIAPVITKVPTNGTASLEAGGVIKYTPTVGFVGIDTIIYKISCDSKESSAVVHITVPEIPDNIDAASLCYTTVPSTQWSIKEAKKFGTDVSTYLTAFVGDLNNDGHPDIVTGTKMNITTPRPPGWWTMHIGKHITVFKGPDHESATTKKEFETVYPYYPVMPGVMAIARVKYAGVDTGMIVVAEGDLKLRAYDADGNNLWTSDENWIDGPLPTNALPSLPETSIGFADFNNDGKAEIYSGNRIFDAETGRLLCKGDQNRGLSRHTKVEDKNAADVTFSVVANIYGDSRLELIAGNQVYEVAQDLSSMRVVREVTPPTSSEDPTLVIPNDGITQIIDIDNDGSLDVVVERWISKGNHFIYVWNPEREEILAQKLLTNSNHIGTPFIGDVDGRKDASGETHPEILLIGSDYGANGGGTPPAEYNRIFAFKYDGTQLLSDFWTLKHSDNSGLTGLVLFDFNQDGISEIVYRDQSHLRIINGSKISHITGNDTTVVYNLATFVNTSGTGFEYPVVADVDADGSAEIIIAGGTSATVAIGAMRIYKSNGEAWAPARKVWNQYAYNVVNVNEDLTIPKYQLTPAMVFPGIDGILGTTDDVRPYNAFLQQQTILNKDGIPLWLVPDAIITAPAPSIVYHSDGDSIVVTLTIKNEGDAVFQNPFYLSAYANSIAEANLMAIDSIKNRIAVNESLTTNITIRNVTAYMPFSDLIVSLNDKGKGVYNQAECKYDNNTYIRPFLTLLLANRDVVHTLKNDTVLVNVLANDSLASCVVGGLTGFDTIPNTGLNNGTLTINADLTFTYTPVSNFVGIDSVMYYIKCGADSSAAKVYLLVNKPLSLSYAACPGAYVDMGFTRITDVQYVWYANQVGPPPIALSPTYPVIKDSPNDIHTWWVEPVWKGVKFPRYRIDLLTADNCGTINPTDCAIDGTVIWKEDFDSYNDGLNPFSPKYSQAPLTAGMTTYTFRSYQGTFPTTGMYAPGNYAIVKDALDPNKTDSWLRLFRDDHTYPSDKEKGRFFVANGRKAKDQLYKQKIDGLCDSVSSLYFSFWARGYHAELKWTIYSSDTDEVLSILSLPPMLDSSDVKKELTWQHYGFKFEIPAGVSSIYFDIYNNCDLASGNDFALDDIEVRLCAPPVTITTPKDTVCEGTKVELTASYDDTPGGALPTFDSPLHYQWQFSATGTLPWTDLTVIKQTAAGVNTITDVYTIPSIAKSHTGYYRFNVSNSLGIGSENCRASKTHYLQVSEALTKYPDIRVQACPLTGGVINLSKYIDTAELIFLSWKDITMGGLVNITPTGLIDAGALVAPRTYAFQYKVENLCVTDSAKLYVRAISGNLLDLPPDTVIVCVEQAKDMLLNQMVGVEVPGTWDYKATLNNYVIKSVAPSLHAGATIFTVKDAYDALNAHIDHKITYKGDTDAAKFEFKYIPDAGNCLSGQTLKPVVVIVTSKFID